MNLLMSTQRAEAAGQTSKENQMTRLLFPCLWFDGNAEEAADFYVSLIPGSKIDKVWRAPADARPGPRAWS